MCVPQTFVYFSLPYTHNRFSSTSENLSNNYYAVLCHHSAVFLLILFLIMTEKSKFLYTRNVTEKKVDRFTLEARRRNIRKSKINYVNASHAGLSYTYTSIYLFSSSLVSAVSMETTVGAGLGMCVLVIIFFLYMNRKWCFSSSSGNFPCCDESLSSKTIHSFSKYNLTTKISFNF